VRAIVGVKVISLPNIDWNSLSSKFNIFNGSSPFSFGFISEDGPTGGSLLTERDFSFVFD